jgi:hypothetical protein
MVLRAVTVLPALLALASTVIAARTSAKRPVTVRQTPFEEAAAECAPAARRAALTAAAHWCRRVSLLLLRRRHQH